MSSLHQISILKIFETGTDIVRLFLKFGLIINICLLVSLFEFWGYSQGKTRVCCGKVFLVFCLHRHEPSIFSCSVYRLLFWFISCTLSWFISCTNQYLRLGMWSYSQQGPICKVFFTNLGPRFRLSIRFTNILLIRENYPSLWTDDFFHFLLWFTAAPLLKLINMLLHSL